MGKIVAGLENLEDSEIIGLVCEGSHPAFSVLVNRHSARFYRLAYRFTSNREEAEDIVQDAFIKLWERPDSWKAGQNVKFTTWFYRVIVNQCLDHKKKHKPVSMPENYDAADERIRQDDLIILTDEQKVLENEIVKLPRYQKTALNLCFYEGLSNQEAADIMGLNLKALQSLIMRAKTTLKKNLKGNL